MLHQAAQTPVQPDAPPEAAQAPARPVGFDEAFRLHGAYVLGLAKRLGLSNADAEDAAQEVFLAVHRNLPTFEARSSLKTWICGITLRTVRNHRRRRARQREQSATELPDTATQPLQESRLDESRALVWLDQVLARLSDERREVFLLFEVEGFSMREVAETLGCSKFTAYTRLYAARRLVKEAARRAGLEDSR